MVVGSKSWIIRFSVVVGCFVAVLYAWSPAKKTSQLTVVADPSFYSEYGPGLWLSEQFKKKFGVTINYVPWGDPAFTLRRLVSEPNFKPDIILGIDAFLLEDWSKQLKWHEVSQKKYPIRSIIKDWQRSDAVAYDWAPLALVAPQDPKLQKWPDLKALKEPRLIVPSPVMSIPGNYFLWWLAESVGSTFKETIKKSVQLVTPDWNSAFEIFNKTMKSLFFTYVTSIDYYKNIENKNYFTVNLGSPLPIHVEYVAIPQNSDQLELANNFIELLLDKETQRRLILQNYMLSVLEDLDTDSGKRYASMQTLSYESFIRFNAEKKKWLTQFLEATQK